LIFAVGVPHFWKGFMKTYKYLILGSGVAAGYAVQELVEQKAGNIGIITADKMIPYDRPPLSKGFLAGEKGVGDILIQDEAFYRGNGVEVLLNREVVLVEFEDKKLVCRVGEEFGYEKLLIAAGSEVRRLHAPGADLPEIYYLRTLADSERIRERMARGGRALVIGSGFIGMEVASVLVRKGLDTTMVFPEERVWKSFFTPEMSAWFQKYFSARGVKFMPGERVTGFVGTRELSGVTLESGTALLADFVVAGIGVVPGTKLFENTTLKVDNGIVLNEYLETSMPDVWAAGDVANFPDAIFNKRRHVEHWDNAVSQGQHAARNMTGAREAFVYVPYFFSDVFDLSYEFWGDTTEQDLVITRGDMGQGSFSIWWLNSGRLMAAFVLNRPEEERELAPKWIRERREVDAGMLRDSGRPLKLLEAA
jgi:NADPH-dependent 2,4-dienoyl-CoA reductase/sulfur reductase-like enzyme